MGKLKEQLAGIAALIAAIVAIGGGFVKYGEITTKLAEIEARESKDYSAQIAVLEEKVAALENVDTSHEHLIALFALSSCAIGPKCTYTQEGTKVSSWFWFYKDKPADLDKMNCN